MRLYPLFYRLDGWLRRKLTPAGFLLLVFLAASAAFGVNTREAQVYQLFGLLLALLLFAALASLRFRPRLEIRRQLPERVIVGEPFAYSVTLTNRHERPCDTVWLRDTLHFAFPAAGEWKQPRGSSNGRRGGYRHWLAWIRRQRGAALTPLDIAPLPPGESITLNVDCLPVRRGQLDFAGIWLGRNDPLGLLRAVSYQALPGKVLVLPAHYPAHLPRLAGTRRLQPGGESFATHVGDAEEFAGVRDYRPGDSPRRLHWKAWARSGRLVVKEYQEEFFVRQALVLDNFSGDAMRFEAAVCAAASLVSADRPQDSLLDLMFVEREAYTLTQGRGLSSEDELLRVLAVVSLAREGDFSVLAQAVEARAARLSGIICILLDWDTTRQNLVASLRARGVPVHVLVIDGGTAPLAPGPLADMPQHLRRLRPDHLAQDLAQP